MRTRNQAQDTSLVDITLPTSWSACTDEQLRIIFYILTKKKGLEAKIAIFLKLGRVSIIKENELGYLCCRQWKRFYLAPWEMLSFIEKLAWIDHAGVTPAPISKIYGRKAIAPRLFGMSFQTYLELESFYQMYLDALQDKTPERSKKALKLMFDILYPPTRFWHAWCKLPLHLELALITWMSQIKAFYSNEFKDFFQPASDISTNGQVNILELANAQIRALTAGDVTKEEQILQIDCMRALTELNAKAIEAKELKKINNGK